MSHLDLALYLFTPLLAVDKSSWYHARKLFNCCIINESSTNYRSTQRYPKITMGNTGNCQTKKKRKFDTVVQSPLLISNLHMKNTKQQAKINYKILAVFI
jgi:hypothetical protein